MTRKPLFSTSGKSRDAKTNHTPQDGHAFALYAKKLRARKNG